MISAFTNTFKIPDLRKRITFTLVVIAVVRVGAVITTPGVNAEVLRQWFINAANSQSSGGVATLFNLFTGGALGNCAIFSLGIMPYISASIMLQLLTAVIPRLGKIAREDGGRQRITLYARYITISLCIIQGYFLALSLEKPSSSPFLQGIVETMQRLNIALVPYPGLGFRLITIITMTAGTLLLMWLGDQITDRGIGNGTSLIITVGILAQLPAGLLQAWKTFVPNDMTASSVHPLVLVLMCGFLVIVIAAVIAVTQAQRKISIQYAKRVIGRKVYGGQTQYMPLKVNYAGVMPIIFAQAILIFPSTILKMALPQHRMASNLADMLASGVLHYTLYGCTIFFFSYFWVATQFQPIQIADDLKKYGGFIPSIRPGKPTADFLDYAMTRLTFAGAVFLTAIAILPQILYQGLNLPYTAAQFFGGTGLLIIVGVILDTMRQIETHLLQRHYDGFLRKGRLRAGYHVGSSNVVTTASPWIWVYVVAAILIITCTTIMVAYHH